MNSGRTPAGHISPRRGSQVLMKKAPSYLAALLVGVACAALLLWFWTKNRDDSPRDRSASAAREAAAGAASPTASVAITGPDAATRALLATLQQLLTRSDTRRREGVLTFKDEAAYRRFLDRAKKAGLTVLGQLDALRAVRVRYNAFSALQADLLQHAAEYANASANFTMGVPPPPAKDSRPDVTQVPFGNRTLAFLGVDPSAAARSSWGRGVTVAVLDTGVAADPTFGTGRLSALDIGLGTTPGNGAEDGHGTAVASLAAGLASDAPGIAPAANILSIRVTDASGTSDIFTVSQAILAAVDAGARVINISLGGYATAGTLEDAIAYAGDHGAVIVAAAGNDQATQLTWPAADPRVVSVGAVDAAEQQVTFSNSGPQLQITAPGYGVQTAWLDGRRAIVDGTSVSSPLVAGAIAAVLSQNLSLTAQQAWQVLQQTADDAGAPGPDPNFGNGILNLGWAMSHSDPTHVDPAISSHYYDVANNQMDVVVQNRSAISVIGLTLNIDAGGTVTTQPVPPLEPGAIHVATVPVDPAGLASGNSIKFATTLVNPPGLVDAVPANNRRTSILTAPVQPK